MIRIFVGCAANGEDIESQAVLDHCLRKYSSEPLQIVWMRLSRHPLSPYSGWNTSQWSTPFSGFRWLVPSLCDFDGRAIYMDSDMIPRADIAKLWGIPFQEGKVVIAKGAADGWRYCVSVWDCAAARKHITPIERLKKEASGHASMVSYFRNNLKLVQSFPEGENWNCIDLEDYKSINDPRIKIIHYSSEAHQPQLKHAVPRLAANGQKHWFEGQIKPHWRPELQALFDLELQEAIEEGRHPEQYLPDPLYGKYVKASTKNYRSHKWAK